MPFVVRRAVAEQQLPTRGSPYPAHAGSAAVALDILRQYTGAVPTRFQQGRLEVGTTLDVAAVPALTYGLSGQPDMRQIVSVVRVEDGRRRAL